MRGSLPECLSQDRVDLARRTSFEIGGEASEFYRPENLHDLKEICTRLDREKRSPYILGGGCNTLFPDGPFLRPIISTEAFRDVRIEGNHLHAGSGLRADLLIRAAIEKGLGGLEFFMGIPGSVGGLVAMNAGGSGYSFGDRVVHVEGLRLSTLEFEKIPGRRIDWGYRTSHLEDLLVTSVELRLEEEEVAVLRKRARQFLRMKASRQPLQGASAGCIFRNPPSEAAAALIDRAGLKGLRQGGAVVSPLHANFILNESGQAKSRDVIELVRRVQERVESLFGVRLETEIVIPPVS